MKHSEKIVMLFVLIGAIFFAREMYPNVLGVPSLQLADESATAATGTLAAPGGAPLLTLPQTSIASADAADTDQGNDDQGSASGQVSTDGTDSVFTRVATTPLPGFASKSYLVGDLTTGAVLAGSNVDARWPTASITKLMTATLAFDQLSSTDRITITPAMFSADPQEYTLVDGGTYTVEDLLHVMLMPSSNVAAQAFADSIGLDQFMSEMNVRAAQWGMTQTYFQDPSGISAANQSTAQDLFTLARNVYDQYPEVFALTDTPATTITNLANGRNVAVKSINVFAGEPGFVGGKTGNTPQAGANLLSIFNYDGHPVVILILGENAIPFGDTTKLYNWFKQDFK